MPMRIFANIRAVVFLAFIVHSGGVAADKLNVLFINVDDMNRDSVGVYGAKVPGTTPNIDMLAAEGLRFEHAPHR